MKLFYYPGCTLKSKALAFDQSARATAGALGIELVEMENFTCCGALYPQTTENLMPLLAPARILVQAQRMGSEHLMTLCSFCYNTLKRANKTLKEDVRTRTTLSEFLEEPYEGNVNVVHLLEVLRDSIGYETLKKKVVHPLDGMRVAAYYGCLLLRPASEIGLDDPQEPSILEDFLETLGGEVVDFPAKTECCGSFLIVSNPALAVECSNRIVNQARQMHIDTLVTSCPLCHYNLTLRARAGQNGETGSAVRVLYFTELLGHALGIDATLVASEGDGQPVGHGMNVSSAT